MNRHHIIKDADGRTQLIVLPRSFTDQFPDDWLAEFADSPSGGLALTLVDPKIPARNKRYKITYAHGSLQVGIPRGWLQDHAARDGDVLEVLEAPNELYLLIRLSKKEAA